MSVSHVHKLKSDHRPLLVSSSHSIDGRNEHPFRMLASWFDHAKFKKVVSNAWSGDITVSDNLDHFTTMAKVWNFTVFGNIFSRKRKVISELKRIQRVLKVRNSFRLRQREFDLRGELEEILKQEEILWFQKSHYQWLSEGDKNTKFFHRRTLSRKNRNKILALKDENNEWCYEAN